MTPKHARKGFTRKLTSKKTLQPIVASLLCLVLFWVIYATVSAQSLGSISPPRLLVSRSPDRSAAVALSGQTLTGPLYIFVVAEPASKKVVFSVDGAVHRTDRWQPYDLNGTAPDGRALPWSPSAGPHTISATFKVGETTQALSGRLVVSATVTTLAPSTSSTTSVTTTVTTTAPAPT